MKIGLLLIGTEILQGKIQDSHTQWLARSLRNFQYELSAVRCCSDEAIDLMTNLEGFKDFDILITSGGLGSTPDDKTKNVLAQFLQKKVTYSEEAKNISKENYAQFDRIFLGSSHTYSFLPQDSKPLKNRAGLAPGIFSTQGNLKVLSLPGVPDEFRSMVVDHLPPLLPLSNELFELITFKTQSLPEEKIFTEVDNKLWEKLSSFGEVSSLPSPLRVDVGVKISGNSNEEIKEKKEELMGFIESHPLNQYIWHTGPESLEEVVINKAKKKNLKIATAESCTGGLVSNRLTNIPGSSAVFWGGVVSYANQLKSHFLNVKKHTLEKHGAVSIECAREMAQGILMQTGVDIGIALTGIAGPDGGSIEKPVGTIYIGIATQNHTNVLSYRFRGEREALKFRFSERALLDLLKTIDLFDTTNSANNS